MYSIRMPYVVSILYVRSLRPFVNVRFRNAIVVTQLICETDILGKLNIGRTRCDDGNLGI